MLVMSDRREPINSLQAGAASVSITPATGIAMQGYGMRYAEGVTDPLLANALAVGSDRVEWLLLSVDCIALDRQFTSRVRNTLANRLLLPSSAITIACSHTHSGPATLPRLGPVQADEKYLTFLERQLEAVGQLAADDLQPAYWRFGATSLEENVNRRLSTHGKVELGVDPAGTVDNRLRVLRIDRTMGLHETSPVALIVHYACHPTTSAKAVNLTADWPGVMRTALQRVYGNGEATPVICFLQGCTGDLTHRIGRDRNAWPEHYEQHTRVQALIMGRLAAASAVLASERSCNLVVEAVQSVVQPLELPFHEKSGSETSEIQVVRIGQRSGTEKDSSEDLWFIGLPGEPFAHYSLELSRQWHRRLGAHPDRVLTCGYTNDCVGYFCTPKAVREGGYEAAMAHRIYHRPSAFSNATEEIVLQTCLRCGGDLANERRKPRHSILKTMSRLFDRSLSPRS